jgi:hypothetical protein
LRIEPRDNIDAGKEHIAHELKRARKLGPLTEPVCCPRCPDFKPSTGCHRNCAAAPVRLSSEGERGPIEPLVAPLVFELKKLGVFYPCWSCEGHTNAAGDLWRVPNVWFYSDSVVHVRALGEAVGQLHAGRQLSARWHLAVTYSDASNPDTTFSLEPDAAADSSLSALQGDLGVMAGEVGHRFWRACDALEAKAR